MFGIPIEFAISVLFFLMILNAFSVFPSEPLLLGLGASFRIDENNNGTIILATLTAFLGYIVGSAVFYYFASRLGKDRAEATCRWLQQIPFVGRVFKWDRIDSLLQRSNTWPFTTYGIIRNLTPIRSIVSAVAGISGYRFSLFMFYTTVGSIPWFAWWITLGYLAFQKTLLSAGTLILFVGLWIMIHVCLSRRFSKLYDATTHE